MTLDQKLLMWICAWLAINVALVTATRKRAVALSGVRHALATPTVTRVTLPASVDPSTSSTVQQPSLGDTVSSVVTQPTSVDPGPVSIQPPSPTSQEEPTMSPTSTSTELSSSPTSSSEPSESSSESSSVSPSPSTIILLQSSETSSPTTSSDTSSAIDTPQPSSSSGSSLGFTVNNMTTCTSGLVSWSYTGKEAQLLLSITNIGVDPSSALSRFKARQSTVNGTIQKQLADTNTSVSSWTWSSVNLTQGWYEIQGLALTTPSVGSNSAPFFITNGTNVACLTDASSTASPAASASSSAVATTNVMDIAGGVVGAVIGVALAVIAGIWLWSRKRKRSFVGDGGNRRQKWGSLKSTNSNVPPGGGGTKPTGDRFHDNSESTDGVLEDVAGGKRSATTTPGDSDEDAAILGEKPISPPSSPGMSPSDALNTHIHYDRRTSPYHPAQIPTTFASESFRSRTASGHTSNQSIEQQAQRIRSSMETPIRRRGEHLSMPTSPPPALARFPLPPTHTQHIEEYPLSPVTATPANRSVSTGTVVVRRGSRKPVPEYVPSAYTEDTNTDSGSTFTGGAESSQTHGTGMGAGTSGTPTDLVRKGSLGDGRPVHYLIPDMPLPQQN